MKTVSIIADSTCDLSVVLKEKYQIKTFPLHIHLGDKEYSDGVDITPDEIYRWSDENKATPKTSAVSPAEANDVLEAALREAETVICFCISETMSSCYSVVNMAVNELEAQDRVHVIDSKNLSTGIGLQIIEAAIMAKKGKSWEEIVDFLLQISPKIKTSFVVDTLTYLHRGGRCSGAAALAGNTLKLHPLIYIKDGNMYPGKKYRGKMDKVLVNYVNDMREDLGKAEQGHVFITHYGCSDDLLGQIRELIEQLDYFDNIYLTRAGGVVSSHCGPGTLGVIYREK